MQADHAMAALSALKVGGGSPNVCFAALRPSIKNSGLSASRKKCMIPEMLQIDHRTERCRLQTTYKHF